MPKGKQQSYSRTMTQRKSPMPMTMSGGMSNRLEKSSQKKANTMFAGTFKTLGKKR